MRTVRAALALVLAIAIPVRAETTTDPLWYLLSTYVRAPDAKAVEAEGEGPADAKGLAGLQADLLVLSDGFESFRDESQVKETLARLQPRISPELRPFFKDRASSLDAVYRTLAVTDYTWAQRFPEPPCAPIDSRRKLLNSRDGLFQTVTGEASPWLVSLLGPEAVGKSAETALDQASSQAKLTGSGYEKLRARVRKLTMALAADKAVGAARSKLYCSRAAAFEGLSAHHRAKETGLIEAGRAVVLKPEESVFVVVWKDRRAAAILLRTKNGAILVTDAAIVAETDNPYLFAYSKSAKPVELAATVVRRHPELSVAALAYAEDKPRPALALADKVPAKDDLVTAVGHTVVSGLWTKTSGLVTKVGEVSFQTDAAVSPELSGGPVLNEAGEVAGMLVLRPADTEEGRWPVAIPAPMLARWLEDPAFALSGASATEQIEDWGTAAILSHARPGGLTEASLPDWKIPGLPPPPSVPNGVCMANCGEPRSPSSSYSRGSSGSAGTDEFGEALGQLALAMVFKGIPMLFRGLGKLSKGSGEPSASSSVANRVTRAKADPPPKPKEAPRLVGLDLTLTPDELLEGEMLAAVATLRFEGDDPKKGGINVTFTTNRGEKTYSALTNASGRATVSIEVDAAEHDLYRRPFEELKREESRVQGEEGPSYLTPDSKPKTEFDKVKQRAPGAFDSLNREEEQISLEDPLIDGDAANDGEADVASDWNDGSAEGGIIETAAGVSVIPPTFALDPAAGVENVPLQKLNSLTVSAKAVAGPMGAAHDSKAVSVMSNRCPPGTTASDPQDGGQPGQPPMGSAEKLALDADCRELESAGEMACIRSHTKVCKDAVLYLLHYDFRACLKRWEPDGDGTAGNIGMPPGPKQNRTPPGRRCVPAASARSTAPGTPGMYAKGLGKGKKRPAGQGARLAFRAMMRALLRGTRFFKNETHAIFEKVGDLNLASAEFEAIRDGRPVNHPEKGVTTVKLADGTFIALRQFSDVDKKGPPTIQVQGPFGEKVKVRFIPRFR